jgi:hypothetical protein
MRLKASIFASSIVRRAMGAGAYAAVARKGHEEGGAVFVKVNLLNGTAFVLTPAPGLGEERTWLRGTGPAPISDADAETYLARQITRDPDCWVIEVEDKQGRWFFEDEVEGDVR